MQIADIFKKDLFRPINGVVKAEQQDDGIVWQELEEYVITRELDKHFRGFFEAYLSALDQPQDPVIAGRVGVWVSGFFGSGKSHFIKILSYLLGNRQVRHPFTQTTQAALDFFKDKVKDHLLFADIKRSTQSETDVILFNIDSKANKSDGQAALLTVFWRVFNEMQGFCGEYRQIAELERFLVSKGKLESFTQAFQDLTGSDWKDRRDAYHFHRDDLVQALITTLGWSLQAAEQWFDKAEDEFDLSIEGFAKRIREYLDARGKTYRLVFLVDEVGQFIGQDTHLMLNLQTLTEDLGRLCQGRVWVVVTSQEDIDAVLGEITTSKSNDFSKIQGRFHTRLSLSSSNTDEVILTRLLEKQATAEQELLALFKAKGDILKNQLSFTYDSATLKNYHSGQDFSAHYPFAPYHFQLVQKIFESIRKAGATGLHLSRGERSMLDAFQYAAKSISRQDVGALVPLYQFYPSIQGFLDTAVKRSIEQAEDNQGLEKPFDIQLLQVLFLVRYVEIIKPNVDNLVTLCIDRVDTDRLALKKMIEAALQRLERENLINRNGDLYYFLTNEEREVAREIKSIELESAAETEMLGEVLFENVLKDKKKHRYESYKRDYSLSRYCDGRPVGSKLEQDLRLDVISPLNDQYGQYNDGKCVLHSSEPPCVLVKLPDHAELGREIRIHRQTDKFIRLKSDAGASPMLKKITRDLADENRLRLDRISSLVESLVPLSECYVLGIKLEQKAPSPKVLVDGALDFLVQNVFNKFGYLKHLSENPQEEIRSVLQSDDLAQKQIEMNLGVVNAEALKEVRTYIDLKISANQPVMLRELAARFSSRPYGWSEWEVVLLIARLFMGGDIFLSVDGGKLKAKDAIDYLTKTAQWKVVKIHKQVSLGAEAVKKARQLGQDLFGALASEDQDKLAGFLKDKMAKWSESLSSWKLLAETEDYPGAEKIQKSLDLLQSLQAIPDTYEFVTAFNQRHDDLLDTSDDFHNLKSFYQNQKPVWKKLKTALHEFQPNCSLLAKYPEATAAWGRLNRIAEAVEPYGMIHEVSGLIARVDAVNLPLVQEKRAAAAGEVDHLIQVLEAELNAASANDALRRQCLFPLREIRQQVRTDTSIPQIVFRLEEAKGWYGEALILIEKARQPEKEPAPIKKVKSIKPSEYAPKAYLETEQDVEDYLGKIREALLSAVKNQMRIRIQ